MLFAITFLLGWSAFCPQTMLTLLTVFIFVVIVADLIFVIICRWSCGTLSAHVSTHDVNLASAQLPHCPAHAAAQELRRLHSCNRLCMSWTQSTPSSSLLRSPKLSVSNGHSLMSSGTSGLCSRSDSSACGMSLVIWSTAFEPYPAAVW